MESVGEYEYNTKDLIGHGAFAVVFKGRHKKHHDQVVAIKSVSKKNIGKSQQFLGKEIKILQEVTKLHHKNVVALLECVETSQKLYIVIEYCNGGDLSEYLNAKGTLSEDTIRLFLRQIAEAVKVLNAKGVVHRDLKPQNILLCHSGKPNPSPSEITLKIADFGFARFLQDGVMAATLCGSPMYMAPEVIMSLKYDAKADLWSIGTIVFQCLTGKAPFMAPNPPALKQFYEKNANLAPRIPSGTSSELTELLIGLMKRDAKDRIEFDQFFNHPFLKLDRPRSSSPVPVPSRRSMSPDRMSPLSPVSPYDSPPPQCWDREVGGEDMAQSPSPSSSSPLQNSKLFQSDRQRDSPSPIEQDYVMIPENMVDDLKNYEQNRNTSPKRQRSESRGSPCKIPVSNSAFRKSGQTTNINLTTKAVSYQAMKMSCDESPRPTSLPMDVPGAAATLTTVAASPYTHHNSEAVPVPNYSTTYDQIQHSLQNTPTSSPHDNFDLAKRLVSPGTSPTSPKEPHCQHTEQLAGRRGSVNSIGSDVCRMTDLTSLTPPPVQFTIGTPPSGGRLRSYSNSTPPPLSSGRQTPTNWRHQPTSPPPACVSPMRWSGNTPPVTTCVPVSATSNSLSPVLGSPSKEIWRGERFRCHTEPALGTVRTLDCRNVNNPHCPMRGMPFSGRTMTLPEFNSKDLWPGGPIQETEDQECFLQRSGSSGRISEPCMLMGPFTFSGGMSQSPPVAALLPYSQPQQQQQQQQYHHHHHHLHHHHPPQPPHYTPPLCQHHCWNCGQSSPARARRYSGTPMYTDSSPTNHAFCYGTSPQKTEELFIAPELTEETLLEKEHNETLAKLNFVSALVKCILELAKTRSSLLPAKLTDSITRNESTTNKVMSEGYQRAVQLLLYMKALHLLNTSLQVSQTEVKLGKLQPSSSVRNVLHGMKEMFHFSLSMCKSLNTPGLLQSVGMDSNASNMTADNILYAYAIEMCQSAALEELFGEPKESFRRYQTAQLLLHSLSTEIQDARDKELLYKYRHAVEKRLAVLTNNGFAYSYDTP